MYRVLIVHTDFPGQFLHLARALAADPRVEVTALAETPIADVPGVRLLTYAPPLAGADRHHPYLQEVARAVLRGQAALVRLLELWRGGYRPDLIVGHNGFGQLLYLKELWPAAPLVGYFEFFYHASGTDLDFDPEYPPTLDDQARVRTMNATHLLGLEACDLGISPTAWQRGLHPEAYRPKILELHDGIDTDAACPGPALPLALPDGTVLRPGDEIVTYAARELEPYRGFHRVMRALPALLARRPGARVVLAGGDGVAYGRRLPDGETYRGRLLAELGGRLDLSRVHFPGSLAYPDFLALMRLSRVHLYLTYPFVLSWSMLEAMACGALVLGSRTPPVEEVVADGRNGLLAGFFDTEGLAGAAADACARAAELAPLRAEARRTVVERYDAARVAVPALRRVLAERFGLPG
ncbi:MAG TPA: glycosyltransferase [Azospirillaceae bacterium]|nr:glycosyltransferase [Azospirillaceae bacterium]